MTGERLREDGQEGNSAGRNGFGIIELGEEVLNFALGRFGDWYDGELVSGRSIARIDGVVARLAGNCGSAMSRERGRHYGEVLTVSDLVLRISGGILLQLGL